LRFLSERNSTNKNIAVAFTALETQINGVRLITKIGLFEELNSIINLGNTLTAKYNTNE
jgi:hypothetical protein|tara:strand:+ start:10 stop:186 length:177 start_codon:yes stop_codon:yes gene_type:complete